MLFDFGLVMALSTRGPANGDRGLMGTPAYMAPEQAEGATSGPAADWHSVGVMLFLALTGRLAFEGAAHEIDADFRASLSDKTTPVSMFYYFFCQAELACLFGDVDLAGVRLREAAKRQQGIFSVPAMVELACLEALVAARQHDTARWTERPGLALRVIARTRKLGTWATSCPANYEAHALIVRAELARIRGQAAAATARFGEPVAAARTPARRAADQREGDGRDTQAYQADT